MANKRRRRGKGLGTVYRRGQLWSIAWVAKGAKQYEHGFPDEDTARRVVAVKIGDLAARRGVSRATIQSRREFLPALEPAPL
jgi:hypothetical protein